MIGGGGSGDALVVIAPVIAVVEGDVADPGITPELKFPAPVVRLAGPVERKST